MPHNPLVTLVLVAATALGGQQPRGCWGDSLEAVGQSNARVAAALARRSVRAEPLRGAPPTIDGRLNENVWCRAASAIDFIQSTPAPGSLATLPSTARILFDDDAVYVAVRLADPHPDSIVAPFPRRDDEVTSDWVFVEIDTRFDRRSGFSFGLNPRGVQVDGTWWADVTYDPAWNGVWQGAAAVDDGGWTAEFRIPFSQLALARSAPGAPLTWGLNIYRYTPHRGESSNWSPRLPSVVGVVSHFNALEGIAAPPRGVSLEVLPYASVTGARGPTDDGSGLRERLGTDVRVRPTPSTNVLVSVRPDFGQVEADPSQVNLTTFETFLEERRPLFVEGADVFQFASGLPFASRGTSFAQESPFYSRRIGRAPRLSMPSGLRAGETPDAAPVLAAARMSARTARGWSGGFFHAWTGAVRVSGIDSAGRGERVSLEPLTDYSVGRLTRETVDGAAGLGFMMTAVNRVDVSPRLDSLLPRNAFVVGTDARKRSASHEVTAFVLASSVSGSTLAVEALRREPRHGYARAAVDGTVPNDSSHRSLAGVSAQARVARITGDFHWGLAGRLITRGFEANDAGFQRNANWLLLEGDWRYQRYRTGSRLRRWSLGSNGTGLGWTTNGDRRAGVITATVSGDLRSYWGGSVTATHELAASDPEVLRGGPALVLPARDRLSTHLYTDTRRAWQLTLDAAGEHEAATGSRRATAAPELSAFVTDRLQIGISPRIGWAREAWQYVARTEPASPASTGASRYVLGRLDQREVSLTTRATAAFSSRLTLQWYAQAFIGNGRYNGFSEVRAPSAERPADRVVAIAPGRLTRDSLGVGYVVDSGLAAASVFPDPAFADRSLHVNTVLRWEFLPGSTAFLVWTQERGDAAAAPFRLSSDLRRLTRSAPTNALQLKVSYWLSP